MAAPFETSYGESLRDVRVHVDSPLPTRFGWDALTFSEHVAFAPGKFRPDTSGGSVW